MPGNLLPPHYGWLSLAGNRKLPDAVHKNLPKFDKVEPTVFDNALHFHIQCMKKERAMNEFGNYLYSLRKSKGMTQQELADKLGVTNKAVSKWETGEAFPETAQLVPLSDIFGVTVDDLLRGKEESLRETKQTTELLNAEQKSVPSEKNKKFRSLGKMLSTITMLLATAIYLLLGFVWELWHPGWVIFPVGGILCGIISAIFNSAIFNKEQ